MVKTSDVIVNQAVEKAMAGFLNEEGKTNILVVGATGSGKSSLVNRVFQIDFAKTGVGTPVTQATTKYEVDDFPITLFDTKGYEVATDEHKRFITEMESYMKDSKKKMDEQIHMIWYCIAASGHRVTETDLAMLKKFSDINKPVCVVLTKSDITAVSDVNTLMQVLDEHGFDSFAVSSRAGIQLPKLMEWTYNHLDDAVKWAFLRAQQVNVELKRTEINKAIRQHATMAFGVGFTPIPFADGPILLANQGVMINRVLKGYGLDGLFGNFENLIGTLGVGQIVSQLGRYLVAQILKFVPGVGTVAGGMINGSVATSLTIALGLTVSEISYRVAIAKLQDENLDVESFMKSIPMDEIKGLFEQFVKDELKRNK
ncbi:GTPase [Lysinibacillus alkalisoli]|uniref:GTPase n=1 Tax=Lysinibacillus alkalisoli TaxID=1911548 RepID=A0A917G0J9_9BACI|nr:GTPase [Lysinibacillus alkalisoli]GGG16678.1 GTPase [Lysinibacillus alkalisoli]